MKRFISITFLFLSGLLVACGSQSSERWLPEKPPAAIPITDGEGYFLRQEEGPLWTIVSGVDEDGTIESPFIGLLDAPDPAAETVHWVATGAPVAIHEIRQTGPQNLWRFYLARTVDGRSGWIPDYFIRRQVYLYNHNQATIPLYATPGEGVIFETGQVTPVRLLSPTEDGWWQVQLINSDVSGWAATDHIKESPIWDYLHNAERNP
jgi:hypothetical protein